MFNIKEFFDPTIRIVDVSEMHIWQLRKLTQVQTELVKKTAAASTDIAPEVVIEVQKAQVENHVIYQSVKQPSLVEQLEQVKAELKQLVAPGYSII